MMFGCRKIVCLWAGLASLFSCGRLVLSDTPVDESSVRRWVVRLDADRRADRQQAEDELLKLGPAALPWLPQPESVGSRATAEALRRVRTKLERQLAETSVEASRIEFRGDVSLGDFLKRLSKETGNVVTFDEIPARLLAQPPGALPPRPTFWDAIESVARLHDLTWSYSAESSQLRLLPRNAGQPTASPRAALAATQAKAFRISVLSVQQRAVVGKASEPLLRVELEVSAEPRLRPLFLKCAAADIAVTAKSADGARTLALPSFTPDARIELTFGQGHRELAVPLDVRRLPGDWTTLHVTGQLHVETAAAEESLEFPAGAESVGVTRRRGGVTVKILRWEASEAADGNNNLDVSVLITYDTGGPAFESHRSWMLFNVVGLVRAGMLPPEHSSARPDSQHAWLLKPTHTASDVQPDGSIAVTYRFEKLPVPPREYHFRYVAPTLILDVPLTFELRDVPLRNGR